MRFVKAYYRRGIGFEQLNKTLEGIKDFEKTVKFLEKYKKDIKNGEKMKERITKKIAELEEKYSKRKHECEESCLQRIKKLPITEEDLYTYSEDFVKLWEEKCLTLFEYLKQFRLHSRDIFNFYFISPSFVLDLSVPLEDEEEESFAIEIFQICGGMRVLKEKKFEEKEEIEKEFKNRLTEIGKKLQIPNQPAKKQDKLYRVYYRCSMIGDVPKILQELWKDISDFKIL